MRITPDSTYAGRVRASLLRFYIVFSGLFLMLRGVMLTRASLISSSHCSGCVSLAVR
ncbi:hypothetical protein BURKHO8Y_30013 [Burkholderia sp. 8Y]|nr:hypothetical protein BURKHO8Y_30013 [Burkholderia sp. 8Y]